MGKPGADTTIGVAAEAGVEPTGVDHQDRSSPPPPRRINVAVTPDMMAAIDRLIDREGVTLTEAVRRLIGYGDVVYRAVREKGQTMFFRDPDDPDGREREIILI